jgi:galactonate dehydratase
MKITDVKVYPVVPDTSLAVSSGSQVGWVFVVVETDEGVAGFGECTNWPRRGDILVSRALETVKSSIIGWDPNSIEGIWHELYRNYTYLGSRGLVTTLISGIDIALWDIKGKVLKRPIYDLLGGPLRDSIPLYTHPQYGTPESTAKSSRRQVEEGYKAIKTDPFWEEMGPYHTAYMSGYISPRGVRRGGEIIFSIRDAVGPEVEILIDAHGNYDVASAVRCAEALKPYSITWFEEPVPPEGYEALRQVRESINIPLCTGERFYTRWDFLPVLQNRLADYLMADVCWTGGITELKKIASLAETYYVPISPHGAMGPIQLIAGAHVAKTIPNFYKLEIFSLWLQAFNKMIKTPIDVREGSLYLSDKPGLGVELDMNWIETHRDPDWT